MKQIKKFLPTRRKLIQLYFALLFNANFKGFVTGSIYRGHTKNVCVPGINCYSCPGAVGACPLGSLQGAFSADKSTLYYVCGILLLYCVLFGRWICGWLCPFGLIQELLHKIPTPKVKKSPVTRVLSWAKYVILVFFVGIVPITYALRNTPLPAFCKYICPAGTIEGGLALLSNKANESFFSMLGPLFTWKFMLMVSILVGCVFVFRLFCRFLCPLGALYGLFNKVSVFGIRLDQEKCTRCGLCVSHCKMDIHHVGDQECIGCGECVEVCPTKAISWKGSALFLKKNDLPEQKSKKTAKAVTRSIVCLVMLAALVGAVAYFWNQKAPITAEVGNDIGDLCFSAQLPIIDENGDIGDTIDPTATGKLTIVNFWGTWCGPCVGELPWFNQIAGEYGDRIVVIAIHSKLASSTAGAFIGEYYPDADLTFSWDIAGDDLYNGEYYLNLGGKGSYPYTLILDENGIILEKIFSAIEYEDLKTLVETHLG